MKCADVYNLFFKPGEVTEIRAYGANGKGPWDGYAKGAGIVYGYFDNAEAFGKCAEALNKSRLPGIYFVLNPVIPDLLARAVNRLKAADYKTVATSDKDILCLRWLYIDLDPIRPSGISSTDQELEHALQLRDKIRQWFVSEKGYTGIPAMSGNGAHIMMRLSDWPNNEKNVEIIKKFLSYLHAKYTTKHVDVDRAVYNPSRICKIYGTVARKGDHMETRPHRRSYIDPAYLEEVKGEKNNG